MVIWIQMVNTVEQKTSHSPVFDVKPTAEFTGSRLSCHLTRTTRLSSRGTCVCKLCLYTVRYSSHILVKSQVFKFNDSKQLHFAANGCFQILNPILGQLQGLPQLFITFSHIMTMMYNNQQKMRTTVILTIKVSREHVELDDSTNPPPPWGSLAFWGQQSARK